MSPGLQMFAEEGMDKERTSKAKANLKEKRRQAAAAAAPPVQE